MTRAVAFSDEWAQAWCRALNDSHAYRAAAATWEGSVGLVMTRPEAAPQAVLLDLWHGECRGARVAPAADVEAAAVYVIAAPRDTWKELLGGRASPLVALMSGKLRLTKGNMATLLPYANAAKELVASATLVETVFPDEAA